jgi:SWI/SNF-related matrix-associated actin-dependent regulator of chromatin subfamily B protein 1
MADPLVKPEVFIQTLVDDFKLPPPFRQKILNSMTDQIAEHTSLLEVSTKHAVSDGQRLKGSLEEEDQDWWEKFREASKETGKKKKGKGKAVKGEVREGEQAKTVRGFEVSGQGGHEDMRIVIKVRFISLFLAILALFCSRPIKPCRFQLDITVAAMQLTDSFEWDVGGPDSAAEDFADVYCSDLGLAGEFRSVKASSCFLSPLEPCS